MSTAFDRDVWAIFGMPIDNITLQDAAARIEHAVDNGERLSFVTPNVNWLVRALKDDLAMRQIINADLSLADGAPVVWLARQLGMPIKERVAGSDVFDELRRADPNKSSPIRVYFFGGREGSAEAAHKAIEAENGRFIAAGWHNPGFGDVDSMTSDDIRGKINAAKPDFIVVSLGAAKGQAWIEKNQAQLDAPVIAHLGAVVDFVAGSITRAPRWASRIGLEWVGRIISEPALWRRYWDDGLDLIGFVSTRLGRLKSAAKAKHGSQSFAVSQTEHALKLSGDLTSSNRDALRHALKTAAGQTGDCRLDLSEISAIDASAFGQVRMLEQCLLRRGDHLHLSISPKHTPVFEAANMTF